ncbi:MAG TPA: glycosyltransferase [Gemmatimonadales bacterium]|nr:glycosyltransferase [Gemmatimonadales bacterium]
MPPILRRVLVISHTYLQPTHRGKLRALAARGLEVTVAIPQRWREPWFGRAIDVAWERQGGLEVFPLPARGMGGKGELAKAKYGRRALKALLRDRRPDLIQIEEEPSTIAAKQVLSAARSLGIPVVLFTHQNVELEQGWWAHWKQRRMLRRLTGLVAGSDLAGTIVRRDAPNLPIAVIPQLGALAPHEPQHVPHEGLAIGFVGRLVPQKGLDNLFQALALLRGAKWRLTIVGDGPEREPLEQLATDLRLAARVRWTGGLPAEQVANLWPDLDVLVQPSLALPDWREANGQILMEAMANEVAVLGTDSGVIPELIADAGVVVSAGDVEGLAAGLLRMTDQATRRGLAAAARARALRLYSDDAIAERTLQFWQQVAK